MIKCANCDAIVDETRVSICPKCQFSLEYGTVINSPEDLREKPTVKKVVRTGLWILAGVGTAILILIYCVNYIISLSMHKESNVPYNRIDLPKDQTSQNNSDVNLAEAVRDSEIIGFINAMEKYEPGYLDGKEFVSEYFGFSYDISELNVCAEDVYADNEKAAIEEEKTQLTQILQRQGVDQDLIDEALEAYYVGYEFVGYTGTDYSNYSQISILASGVYGDSGINKKSVKDIAEEFCVRYNEKGITGAKALKLNFAGIDCYVVRVEGTDNGAGFEMNQILYMKDHVLGSVTIKDYGEGRTLYEHFINNVREY